ncbi:hypothetical protein, variant [Aphanomyces invadans]|uniref:Uncharacterized protein n=1 Tax=Aphanomyces invadans TaxID=157072 RepID=A0A024TB02_9STRA|nr:hypothetical protein, variant [Aphanomyces invadans]ETV91189.1 hypothetical protein, variant [Aphanomyces invadans]|eukprot:XP_008880219.1 hypothetical protein, variant [Aphanomyces invadans]
MGCRQSTAASAPAPHGRPLVRYSVEASRRSLLRIADHLDELEDAVPDAVLAKWERIVEQVIAATVDTSQLEPTTRRIDPCVERAASSQHDVEIVRRTALKPQDAASPPVVDGTPHDSVVGNRVGASSSYWGTDDTPAAARSSQDANVNVVLQNTMPAASLVAAPSNPAPAHMPEDPGRKRHGGTDGAQIAPPEGLETARSQRSNTMLSFVKARDTTSSRCRNDAVGSLANPTQPVTVDGSTDKVTTDAVSGIAATRTTCIPSCSLAPAAMLQNAHDGPPSAMGFMLQPLDQAQLEPVVSTPLSWVRAGGSSSCRLGTCAM